MPANIRREQVADIIAKVGLCGFEKAYPKELSGGMKKRVDLARVLVHNPKLLLMDEPFGSLAAMTKERLQVELTSIWEQARKTILFVTHDIEEALFLGDRVCIMHPERAEGVIELFKVNFARPRDIFIKETPAFQALRKEIIKKFHHIEAE